MWKKIFIPRLAFALLAILLQLGLLVGMVLRFQEYFGFFYGGSLLVSAVAVVWILNDRSNPAYKIAWIIPILLFPVFGGIFYLLFGRPDLDNTTKRRMGPIMGKVAESLPREEELLAALKEECPPAAHQARYIRDYAHCPPCDRTEAEYLPTGELKFARLKEVLRKAERYIFLEYFIIEEGVLWDSVLEILLEKAGEGVDVRLIYDDAGCLFTLPERYDRKLEAMGIRCCVFNPLGPVFSLKVNNRDHRKLVVVDGHTGFTGGINLADEYINEYVKYGHWKDSAILLRGAAVWSMSLMFLSMWEYLRREEEDWEAFRPKSMPLGTGEAQGGCVQPFADNPLDGEPVGETVYLNIINKAQRYVHITSPYLIIDSAMASALCNASKGGVDVRIVTPNHPDKKYVHAVTRSYYGMLLESGVKIYEYTPGFIHSKTFVADGLYGVVGTINMDYRSLYLHFECGVWIYRNRALQAMEEDFRALLEVSRPIGMEDVWGTPWYRTLGRFLLRVFAPLL
ncbi:cardiolipin synthase [Anaerotalea alkaliphila]|uniref:cardiolipin synthase n=1 Tax=Anaerotalea alkaliphila TaxID=2662126 RepID=UPI0031B6513C